LTETFLSYTIGIDKESRHMIQLGNEAGIREWLWRIQRVEDRVHISPNEIKYEVEILEKALSEYLPPGQWEGIRCTIDIHAYHRGRPNTIDTFFVVVRRNRRWWIETIYRSPRTGVYRTVEYVDKDAVMDQMKKKLNTHIE